jgi:methionine-rich copper-binding protein CopC
MLAAPPATGETLMQSRFLTLVLLFILAATVAFNGSAGAHAKLVRADPSPGSIVKVVPLVVRAWFNAELNSKSSTIGVWDARGQRADDGRGGVDLNDMDRKSLQTRLKPLRPGKYTVKWKAVSADDADVAQGTFQFTVVPR